MTISPGQIKSLLAVYATDQARSVRSQLSDRRGGAPGSCILTIGIIVSRTPPRYCVHGASILQKWCDARKLEAEVLDELAVARSLKRSTVKIDIIEWCTKRVKALDRAGEIATEQVWGYEGNHLFGEALVWAAADLDRRLSHVPDREMVVWSEMLDEKVLA